MSTIGRPSIYKPGNVIENEYDNNHPQYLLALLSEGKLDIEVIAALGISKDTFYRWLREKEDFKQAYNLGLPRCEAIYIAKARTCWEAGDEKGFKYFIALMNNKFGWGDTEKSSQTRVTHNNININTMQVLNTREQYLELLDQTKAQALELTNLGILPEKILNESGTEEN
jgi:hypothetical protein